MRKLYQILYNVGRLTDAPGGGLFLSRGDTLAVGLFPFLGDTLAWAGLRGGKALGVTKPAFPPRAPPFRARSCCALWKCEYILVGRWILRCWQCNVTPIYTQVESAAPRLDISRQTTGKLSLSSRSSSAALMTHPTYGKPLYISP